MFLPSSRSRIASKADQATENADGIGFENGQALIEPDREYGPRRVAANAGERADFFHLRWKLAPVPGDNETRSRMQLSGPAIVAQPFPQPQHVLLLGSGEQADAGEAL